MLNVSQRAAVTAVVLLWGSLGCGVLPCSKDSTCPPATYCRLEADRGVCAQDCVMDSQCGEGRTCTGTGRCKAAPGLLELRITAPTNGQQLSPGDIMTVEGTVMLGTDVVVLEVSGTDGLECAPVRPQVLELSPTGRRERATFRFPDVVVGQGGGRVAVKATAGLLEDQTENVYASGVTCPDCPAITLEEPVNGPLPPYALASPILGQVDGIPGTTTLFSESGNGVTFRIPLVLGASGVLSRRVVPVLPGASRVGLMFEGPTGTRTCYRHVTATAAATPLAAHLSWDGDTADLDLLVIPPSATPSRGACRTRATVAGCSAPTPERTAPGPEAILVDTLGDDGAWGVAVLGIPGVEGPVRAVVTLTVDGEVVEQLGPRTLDPRLPESWLVGRVLVTGGVRVVEVLDTVVAQLPGGPPDTW
jgi:hypothetical protein